MDDYRPDIRTPDSPLVVATSGDGLPDATFPRRDAGPEDQLWGRGLRTLTLGMVALVALIAFESLAIATVMPQAATALQGLAVYGLAFGAPLAASMLGMVASGGWSDRSGPAPPLWAGIACFVVGLAISGVAPTMAWLLSGRVVSGLGSGMMSVALYALVGRIYPKSMHARVFTAYSAAWVVPSLLGPGVSGLVAEHLGWRWMVLGMPVLTLPAACLLWPALRGLPATTQRSTSASWGISRIAWACGAGVGALLLHYVGQASANHAPVPSAASATSALLLMAAALVLLLICASRLFPSGTLRARRGLPASLALHGVSQAAFFAAEAFLPLLLARERGLSAGMAGLVLTAGALSWSAGAALRGPVGRFMPTSSLLRMGMVLVSAGVGASLLVILPTVSIAMAILGWAIAGLGMGMVSPTLSVLTLALSPPGRQGDTGAALRLSAAMFTTTALALNGSVFAMLFVYAPTLAYAGSLAVAMVLALLGIAVASRAVSEARSI